jgi:hypothetical protein
MGKTPSRRLSLRLSVPSEWWCCYWHMVVDLWYRLCTIPPFLWSMMSLKMEKMVIVCTFSVGCDVQCRSFLITNMSINGIAPSVSIFILTLMISHTLLILLKKSCILSNPRCQITCIIHISKPQWLCCTMSSTSFSKCSIKMLLTATDSSP